MNIFVNFINEARKFAGRELIAIDRKTLRHSYDGDTQNALHSITVWSKSRRFILPQQKSSGKKNEQAGVLNVNVAILTSDGIVSCRLVRLL